MGRWGGTLGRGRGKKYSRKNPGQIGVNAGGSKRDLIKSTALGREESTD